MIYLNIDDNCGYFQVNETYHFLFGFVKLRYTANDDVLSLINTSNNKIIASGKYDSWLIRKGDKVFTESSKGSAISQTIAALAACAISSSGASCIEIGAIGGDVSEFSIPADFEGYAHVTKEYVADDGYMKFLRELYSYNSETESYDLLISVNGAYKHNSYLDDINVSASDDWAVSINDGEQQIIDFVLDPQQEIVEITFINTKNNCEYKLDASTMPDVSIWFGASAQMTNNGFVRTIDPTLNLLKSDPIGASESLQTNHYRYGAAYGNLGSYYLYVIAPAAPEGWTWRNSSAPATPHTITWQQGDLNPVQKCYRAVIDDGDPDLINITKFDAVEMQNLHQLTDPGELGLLVRNIQAIHGGDTDVTIDVVGTEMTITFTNIFLPSSSITVNTENNSGVEIILEEIEC